jgi:hypothetical protein
MNINTTASTLALLSVGLGLAVSGYSQSFLTNGLVAYYPFNGNANDASGNGNNGTVYGATDGTNRFGVTNSSFNFNGTNQYISFPAASFLNGAQKATISLWVQESDTNHPGSFFGDWTEATGGIYLNDYTGSNFAVAILPNGQVSTATQTLVGEWRHVVVVFDGTQTGNEQRLACYFNGVSNALSFPYTIPATLGEGSSSILVGGRQIYGNPSNFFLGRVDDVRIYNRVLSSNEVQELYLYESTAQVGILQAVIPTFFNLYSGTNYQLQVSPDLNTWTNSGSVFTATNSTMIYPQYFLVNNWNQLFFRLQTSP